MPDFFNGQIVKQCIWILMKHPSECLCLNYFWMTKGTPNQHSKLAYTWCLLYSLVKSCKTNWMNLSELANTVCLLKSLFSYRMYTQSAHSFLQDIVSALCNDKIMNQSKRILVKYLAHFVSLTYLSTNSCNPNQQNNSDNTMYHIFPLVILCDNRNDYFLNS